MKKMSDVLKENYDKLITAGRWAYQESMKNPNFRHVVEINNRGDINTWREESGGNGRHVNDREKIVEVFKFDQKGERVEVDSEGVIELVIDSESVPEEIIAEWEEIRESDPFSYNPYTLKEEYPDFAEEFESALALEEKMAIDHYASEWDGTEKLDELIEGLEREEREEQLKAAEKQERIERKCASDRLFEDKWQEQEFDTESDLDY